MSVKDFRKQHRIASASGLGVALVVWGWALTVCIHFGVRNPLHFSVGAIEAAYFAASQNDSPMCGRNGALQERNGVVTRCWYPGVRDWFDRDDRKVGWDWFMSARQPDATEEEYEVIPSSVRRFWHDPDDHISPYQLLTTDDRFVGRAQRIAILLALHPEVDGDEDLLFASDDEILWAIGSTKPIARSNVSHDASMYRGYEKNGRRVVFDPRWGIVVQLEDEQ